MVGRLIQVTKSAYQYPLIFKQLWHTPRVQAPDQEIVYRDLRRFTYLQIKERIGRLASALSKAGVVPGDTVGVLDWDSHRFLEAFFAIPMMGAVLQTVNVRLSPEQIAYPSDHFLHHWHDRTAQGGLLQPSPARVAHDLRVGAVRHGGDAGPLLARRC